MYACFAFFPDGSVKRWKYVTNLTSFMLFLSKSHSTWKYFNVYEKGSKQFAKRFYPGNTVPKVLGLLMLFSLLTQKFTFGKSNLRVNHDSISVKNTFGKNHLQLRLTNAAHETFNKTTLINGFNNTATISTNEKPKGGIV